jgi:hypothetical protein
MATIKKYPVINESPAHGHAQPGGVAGGEYLVDGMLAAGGVAPAAWRGAA